MPTGNEDKKYTFSIHINGKDHEYESFEEMFSDFVDDTIAANTEEDDKESEMQKCADAMYDLFTCFMTAGFTEEQALWLVGNIGKK